MKKIDIDNSTLRTLCFSLRNGALTSSELAQWSISNHELIGKDLNAYKTWDKLANSPICSPPFAKTSVTVSRWGIFIDDCLNPFFG